MRSSNHNIIILSHKNIGESDQLLNIYDFQSGKQKIIAKGARRIKSKFTGYLQTLNFCRANLYHGPHKIILQEIEITHNYLPETKDFKLLDSALRISEITNHALFENQIIETLPHLIASTLTTLRFSTKYNLILLTFIIKLLDQTGNMPDLRNTKINIPTKYQNLLNYIKEKGYQEIMSVKIEPDDEQFLEKLIEKLSPSY
ncbi:DNA repair protein RecO [Candidatus Peregrinibacteria bacterium HGW-Peregrinibacteria-1]|jgi:DNA repair protein RecO (recombination protein O)|nr:MAG: DNA repair protein RecO [Candidatus Peregrinibacteria bacterium HGW-Peregrinibacteria-1]